MHFEIVDAFTKDRFAGNPAAVIVFGAGDERFSNDSLLQSIAAEFNLSETAYNIPTEDSTAEDIKYRLRWFTPTMEINLCGHATVASAHSLFTRHHPTATRICFSTMSGVLVSERTAEGSITLDLPSCPLIVDSVLRIQSDEEYRLRIEKVAAEVSNKVEGKILRVGLGSMGPLVELKMEVDLAGMEIDPIALTRNQIKCLTFTQAAPASSPFDIFSRVLAPGLGIKEDPVTGSAYGFLGPYWLGSEARKRIASSPAEGVFELRAQQVGPRKGEMTVIWDQERKRVKLVGEAVTVAEGKLIGV